MKKRLFSIILVLLMIFAEAATCVLAEGEVAGEAPAATVTAPAKLTATPAYNGVTLKWPKAEGASTYNVYRDGKLVKKGLTALKYYDKYITTKAQNRKQQLKNHKYYVEAVAADGTTAKTGTIESCMVQQMYISIVLRAKARLTSHDKAKVSKTFKANTPIITYGFGGGKYKFYSGGHLFYVSYLRTRAGSSKALFTKKFNYSKAVAENFVNTNGQTSKTKWLIWVNQYTQHLYVFKGSKGKWKVYDHWEISSGKPSTPSPTGFNKAIYKKVSNRHGLGPWTVFQSWTSFHGKQRSWKLGAPASGACIRNPNEKSRWIYKTIPTRTAVIIY